MLQTLQSNVQQGTWRPYSNSNTIGLAGYMLKTVNPVGSNPSLAGLPGVDVPSAVTDIPTEVLVDDGANPIATTNQAAQVTALPLSAVDQFRAIVYGSGNVGDQIVLNNGSAGGAWGQVDKLTNPLSAVIASASNGSPNVFTSNNHGLNVGDKVVITGATGDTTVNGTWLVNTVPTANTFTLKSLTGTVLNTGGTYTASSATFLRQNLYTVLGFALETYVTGQLLKIRKQLFQVTA